MMHCMLALMMNFVKLVNEVKRTDKLKFLRVLIDDKLSFRNHVSVLQKQVSMATGMLNKVSNMVPVEVKLKAYYALI